MSNQYSKKYKDIEIGDVFDRLTVIGKGKYVEYKQYWIVECSCNKHTIKEVRGTNLNNGHVKSCGCLNVEAKQAWNNRKWTLSFYDWCINNKLLEFLDLWDYDKNIKSPKEIGCKSNKEYYFKCPKHLHKSELHRLDGVVNNYLTHDTGIICTACNSFAQWGIDNVCPNFLEKYWDYDKNVGINPWKIAHKYNKKVYVKCQEKDYHGSYEISCSNFTNGQRCPYCTRNSGKVHKLDSLGYLYPQVLDIWSDKNKKSPYEYSPMSSSYKVWWKCPDGKHEEYFRRISETLQAEFRCPECTRERIESLLQEKVRKYITKKYKYKINHEYNCNIVPVQPKHHHKLPFDNEVVNLKLIIEVNGLAHYKIDGFIKHAAKVHNITPEEEFHKRKLYDRYKKYVAFCNGYFYLAIPYWTEKDGSYKQLIDNKIKEILKINKAKSVV